MATKISNVMLEIQTTKKRKKNPTTPSLKNVATSSSNEKEEKQYKKKLDKKKPINFHSLPKFLPPSTTIVQIPKGLEDHCQQKNGEDPPTHTFFSNLPLHFESTNHLSLGFLHPLGFLNFDRLNHFKHACSTKFVSNDQLTHESF